MGALLLSVGLVDSATMAQSVTPSMTAPMPPPNVDEARRLFEQGVIELRDERFSDAVISFRASQQIRESASVSLNLGISLRSLGQLIESRREFMTFLRLASPTLRAQNETVVNTYLTALQQRIAVLTIAERTPANTTITVDRQSVGMGLNGEIELNPGAHEILGESQGFRPFRQTLTLTAGARTSVRISLERNVVSDPRVTLGPVAGAPVGPVTSQWWFWTVVGVGAAAVIATTVVVVATSGYNDPAMSTTGRVIQGISN